MITQTNARVDVDLAKEIVVNGKPCNLMKAAIVPKYGSKTILTDSAWEYVSLFLKRQSTTGSSDALFYWEQAHSFYLASLALPDNARPLTSYYCILNASKALLRMCQIDDSKLNSHGISTDRASNDKISLKEAQTVVKGAGVLPELSKMLDCPLEAKHYSIHDLLYNIPCVHRAFCITFAKAEMFVPVAHPVFVKKDNSKEAWFQCTVDGRYANKKALKNMPSFFEHDKGMLDNYVIRTKKRFDWDVHVSMESRKGILCKQHKRIRHTLYYIYGESRLWYIKKNFVGNNLTCTSSAVLIFCVFHWLSELVRYNPKLFQKYMKSKQNWLLHEFIVNSLEQFVDEVSCEITGEDIMCTGYRK